MKLPKSEYAISIREIVFIFFIFSFVLYFLFPKESLKEKVLKENKSNELVLVYIENMIKFDPENYKLLLHFADISLQEDNFYTTKAIVEMLLKVNNEKARESAIVLGEKLFKRQYFLLKRKKEKEKLIEEYKDMLFDMVMVTDNDKLREDILTYLLSQKKEREYLKFLKALSKKSFYWKRKLADYYLSKSEHKKAFLLYKDLIKREIPLKEKREVFSKIIDILIYGAIFDEGIKIVQKYQNIFLNDKEISKKIIKFYLAANRPDLARRYVLKLKVDNNF
ncbi:MAG: hypothetical protein GXO31_03460 [Epsilonproteobacteria bacterium]|nr:hypothetical protein [Campylobacterota bacterium]